MRGVLLVDKPVGITSNDVLQKIKKQLNIKKAGHTGTLDPLASGLLIVLINQDTKLSDFLLNDDKEYEFVMQLFMQTNTGDSEGRISAVQKPKLITQLEVEQCVSYFNGLEYDQIPPIYSAIKVKGKKLYEYAIKDEQVDVSSRKVTIKNLTLMNYNKKDGTIKLKANCSKGTYIRSLCKDIGIFLGTYATVVELIRTKSGHFDLRDAKSLEKVEINDIISGYEALLTNKKPMIVHYNIDEIKNGVPIIIDGHSEPFIFLISKDKSLLAVYEHIGKHMYRCKRGLWT